tara:strand:- start:681 stop:1283 length:603 start_codon:yes stop_codon:yes gene_type:complete
MTGSPYEPILREYIRAAAMSLPDPRTGSGYGTISNPKVYQKQGTYPYREPDILDDESCEEDDLEDLDPETEKKLQNKVSLTHKTSDPYKRRDYGSFSGHSVRFDLHQGAEKNYNTVNETSGVSITPMPGLYKGRQAGGATGGVSPVGYTTGHAPRGGVTSKRSFAAGQKLPRDEKRPRKYRLVDILFDEDEPVFIFDEEV